MRPVRSLTDAGTQAFRDYVRSLREGGHAGPPYDLLIGEDSSEPITGQATVEERTFGDSMEAGSYLVERLGNVAEEELNRPGVWNWLSLLYFGQLCPAGKDGHRSPRADDRYLLSSDFRKSYRHLLATPYRLVRTHGDRARALLMHPLSIHSDLTEQLASRQEIMTNTGLMEAADVLYFDAEKNAPKKNAANRTVRGSARRLVAVAQQLDLTYDLYSMDGEEVLELLPPEFDRWR